MHFATWFIVIGAVVLLALAAGVGSRSAGSPLRRAWQRAMEPANRGVILSEAAIVVGALLLGFGLAHGEQFYSFLGLVLVPVGVVQGVIYLSRA